jgi:hypothetical protein
MVSEAYMRIMAAVGWLVYQHVEFRDFCIDNNYGELFGCSHPEIDNVQPEDIRTLLKDTPWEDIKVSCIDEDLITLTVEKE